MAERGVAAGHRERLAANPVVLSDPDAWVAYLRRHLVDSPRAITLVTEGALLGGLVTQGFRLDLRLLSDDAGQFALFVHALCWVHAERPLQQLLPERRGPTGDCRGAGAGLDPLSGPNGLPRATDLGGEPRSRQFDTLCATVTPCEPLHQVLQSFQRNRDELLRVLDYPDLPLLTTAARTTCATWSRSARSAPAPGARPGDDAGIPSSA